MIDVYNNGMNHVDCAYQLCGTYRFDHWMRTRKWWWSIWMWGVSSTTNKFVCDVQDSQHTHLEGKCKKKFFHNFRKMIALAWLCPTEYTNGKNLKCKNNDGNSSRSIRTINSSSLSNKKQKCAYITDDSIHPAHGSLKIWRSSLYQNYPACPHVKDPTCSLHRWPSEDNSFKKQGNIIRCDCCNINLCIDCFPLFHTVEDVKKLKAEVRKIIISKKICDIPGCR